LLADHGTERNRPPYCGRVPVSRRHGAPLRLAVCVEHTEQWPARADRTRFAAVGAGRFRPAIGPPQSATAQTAVPRRWRAAAATADPACNVIPAQPGRAAPHACPGQPLSDQTHHWIRMRNEHRRGFGDRIAHRSFGKGGQQQQPKNFASDYPGRAPCPPVLLRGSEGPTGAGGAGWPLALPASPGGACNGSEAAACPGLRSPEAFAAAPPHCAACRRPNRT
jgi:hypothetical protein